MQVYKEDCHDSLLYSIDITTFSRAATKGGAQGEQAPPKKNKKVCLSISILFYYTSRNFFLRFETKSTKLE